MRTKQAQTKSKRNASTTKRDNAPASPSVPLQQAPLIEVAEQRVRAQLGTIEAAEGDGFDKNAALAAAAILRSLVSSEGERRQRAKQEVRAIASIPLDQIVAFLRTLPAETKTAVCREVNGDSDEEPLL